MTFLGYSFIIFFIGLSLFLFAQKARLFYNRNLRTYKTEIHEYLQNQLFDLIETRYPKKRDWINSPFDKPSKIDFSIFRINGSNMKWRQKDYLLIIGQNQEKYKEFWLEIETEYFRNPILKFRNGKTLKLTELQDIEEKVKYIEVKDFCPACSCKLKEGDKICPDCGLNFE